MSKQILFISAVLTTGALLNACSPSGSGTAPSTTTTVAGVSGAIANVQEHIKAANIVAYSQASEILHSIQIPSLSPMVAASAMDASDWTTVNADIVNLTCGGPPNGCNGEANGSSPAKWVQDMLSPTFMNSNGSTVGLMGRFVSAVSQTCMLGYALGTAIPAAGTSTITLDQTALDAGNALCGTNISGTDLGGLPASIAVTVTDVSGQGIGQFDRRLDMTPPGGGGAQTMYVKNDGTISRVMTLQTKVNTDSNSNSENYLNRYYAEYNNSTGVAKFEGLEFTFPVEDSSGGGFYFYRIWSNSQTNEIRAFGQNGGISCSNTSSGTTVCPTGDLVIQNAQMMVGSGNTKIADATFEIAGTTSGGVAPAWDKIGCINMSTGIVDTANQDGTGACNGRTVNDTTGYPLVNTTALSIPFASWVYDGTIGALSFDDTTITSVAPTN